MFIILIWSGREKKKQSGYFVFYDLSQSILAETCSQHMESNSITKHKILIWAGFISDGEGLDVNTVALEGLHVAYDDLKVGEAIVHPEHFHSFI